MPAYSGCRVARCGDGKASTTDRMMTVATHAAFMSWQHGVKILAFGFLGFAFAPYAPLMILMVLFGVVGTWSGRDGGAV